MAALRHYDIKALRKEERLIRVKLMRVKLMRVKLIRNLFKSHLFAYQVVHLFTYSPIQNGQNRI